MSDRGSEKFQGMVMELVLVCCYLGIHLFDLRS